MAKKLKRKKKFAEVLIILGVISVIIFTILFIKIPLFYFGILGGLLLIYLGNRIFKEIKRTIDQKLIPEVYKKTLGTNYYRKEEGFNSGAVYSTNLFSPQERFLSDNLSSGEVFGFKYKLSEIHLLSLKREFTKSVSETLFKGTYAEVNVESRIVGSVYIVPKNTKIHHYLGKEHQVIIGSDLDKAFDVYAKNKKEVKKLFKEDFEESLQKILKVFPTVFLAVKKHALYMAVDSRKVELDAKLFKKLNLSYLDTLTDEIVSIKEIVHVLYKKEVSNSN